LSSRQALTHLNLDYRVKSFYICCISFTFALFKFNLNKLTTSLDLLKRGEKAIIVEFTLDMVPLKLLEMGCLPGNEVELVQIAPFKDPMYLNINGSHLAIRKETASHITVEKLSHE